MLNEGAREEHARAGNRAAFQLGQSLKLVKRILYLLSGHRGEEQPLEVRFKQQFYTE